MLGKRPNAAYSYSDILATLMDIYLCGGDHIEDVNGLLRKGLSESDCIEVPSPATGMNCGEPDPHGGRLVRHEDERMRIQACGVAHGKTNGPSAGPVRQAEERLRVGPPALLQA